MSLPPHYNNRNHLFTRAGTVVRLALGVLLLGAAGLKLAGQNVSAVPQVGWYATPMVQMAAAEWELVLGIWLLSGRYRTAAWLATLATFAIFAGVSGYLGSIGVASCGCTGPIRISPWWAFGVDFAAAVMLLAVCPFSREFTSNSKDPRNLVHSACAIAAVVGMVGLFAGATMIRFGSVDAGLAYWRGELITVQPRRLDLGRGTIGEYREVTIQLVNRDDRPVRLIGGTIDCSCDATLGLPVTLLPGQKCTLPVSIRMPDTAGIFTRRVAFRTDDPLHPNVSFLCSGISSDPLR